jgi:hypothetical protein
MSFDIRGGQTEELARKYGLPVGLGVAAMIFFLIRAAGAPAVFAWLGLMCAISAVAIVVRMRSAAEHQQALARRSTTPVSDETRRQLLQEYLSRDLHSGRGRVESVTAYTAVMVYGKPVNHVLHLLATVLCCGLWLPIWILIAIDGGEKRRVLSVDHCGNVITS